MYISPELIAGILSALVIAPLTYNKFERMADIFSFFEGRWLGIGSLIALFGWYFGLAIYMGLCMMPGMFLLEVLD
jgi:hypothetical protein